MPVPVVIAGAAALIGVGTTAGTAIKAKAAEAKLKQLPSGFDKNFGPLAQKHLDAGFVPGGRVK